MVTIQIPNKALYFAAVLLVSIGLVVNAYAYTSAAPNPGHGGDSVLVAVSGQEKTLQSAIDSGNLTETAIYGRAKTSTWAQSSGNESKQCKKVSFEFLQSTPQSASWGLGACGRNNIKFMDDNLNRLACVMVTGEATTNGCKHICFKCDEWE